uniref:aminoglycoside 6'-N-acetyltransferase n=2 Tax=Streptomyces sulphureus TaxID=47758 RepID=UPI000475D4CB|nr:aminoglycoside 6'-N-acetyltransferase [Streptomyces sulphureus]
MCCMELHGEKVVLRPVEDSETETLDRIVREPEVAAWWSPPNDYRNTFAVFLDDEIIGAVQFTEESDPEYRHAGIDVFLTARRTGAGLGTDTVRTLARWLLDDRGHHRLTIDPAAENAPAIASYRKVGFQPVGVLRRYWRDHQTGEWRDGLLMDLLADELA